MPDDRKQTPRIPDEDVVDRTTVPPGTADDAGIVHAPRRPGDKPQADPEVPELGEWEERRRDMPEKDATGF